MTAIQKDSLDPDCTSTAQCAIPVDPKTLGAPQSCAQSAQYVGNPINAGTGNKYQAETDYTGPGDFPLSFTRHYNSQSTASGPFGVGWSAFARLALLDASHLSAHRPDGKAIGYTLTNGTWHPDADISDALVALASGYRLTTAAGDLETYDASGKLLTLTDRAGHTQTLSYDTTGQLSAVTDAHGRSLAFSHDGANRIDTMANPAGGVYSYAYDANNNLASVTYPDATSKTYHYENATFPHALTGISDENGARYATYAYDAEGRATVSEHANGTEYVGLAYNPDGSTTVTDALGSARTYTFTTVLGVVKSTGISQPGGSGCGAAASNMSYDANGSIARRADFNGPQTCHAHDLTRNLETARVEGLAAGATCPTDLAAYTPAANSAERKILTEWHSTFRLPTKITEAGRETSTVYDTRGNVTSTTLKDTATNQTRTWGTAYTYHPSVPGALLQKTEDGPRTDVADLTTWDYYPPDATCAGGGTGNTHGCRGQLKQLTNALGHVTQITRYNAHGQPEVILDPNGVPTTLAYDPRQRLVSHSLDGHTTTFAYDPAGQLIQTTLPDGGSTTYSYDAAHRLIGIADALGNRVSYTLDGLGNRIAETWHNHDGSLAQTRSQSFDALGRLYQEVGAANQTTTHTHDPQGNPTGVTDPKNQTTTQAHDALDRLTRLTDALNGLTQIGYDPLDQVTSVTVPNGAMTQYVLDGLGNLREEGSPDRGNTLYTHDAAGNVVSREDGRGVTASYSHDALNRLTGVSYPSGKTLAYTWDAAPGCTYGIGRLCQVTDTAGSTTYAYDARGNAASETRSEAGQTFTTQLVHAAADRLQDLIAPTGETLNRSRNLAGRITQVTAASAAGTTVVSQGLAYAATGQVTAQTLGEGLTVIQTYDPDGQPTFQSLSSPSTTSGNDGDVPLPAWAADLSLTYDANGNVASKTTQTGASTYSYDPLDRIDTEAGPAGARNHEFDANGNRATDSAGNSASYVPKSNRLATIDGLPVTLDAIGNITGDGRAKYVWDEEGHLAETRKPDNTLLATYYYDYRGLRTRKVTTSAAPQGAGTTFYLYDPQGHPLAEMGSAGQPLMTYVWRDDTLTGIVVHQPQRTVYTVRTDHLGSPYEVMTLTGKVVWRWESEAFGATAPNEDPDLDGQKFTLNLRFPGQYFDLESGLHYNHHRYYSPKLGRYMSADPIGLAGGSNLYSYVGGNPISRIDPKGLAFDDPGNASVYPPNYNTQENYKWPVPSDADTACWIDCQLKKQAICSSFGLAGGGVGAAIGGLASLGGAAYLGFAVGDVGTTLACKKFLPMDCGEKCKPKTCKAK